MTWTDAELAAEVAGDIRDGWVVNLGIGMPTSVSARLFGRDVLVHSENGIIGMGPPPAADAQDVDLVDAGKAFTTLVPGGTFIESSMSFALIRGGRLDLAVMGAYQVSFEGDLANWRLPGRRLAGIGGAADLAVGARQLWVMTRFRGPDKAPKLVPRCSFPVTARRVVDRVYTEVGVFAVGEGAPSLLRAAPGIDAAATMNELGGPMSAARP